MTELDRLEQYLKCKGYEYKRIDEDGKEEEISGHKVKLGDRHQILVFNKEGVQEWDAICHFGSYGYEQGLLEIMGTITEYFDEEDDGYSDVVGYLTAREIIQALKEENEMLRERTLTKEQFLEAVHTTKKLQEICGKEIIPPSNVIGIYGLDDFYAIHDELAKDAEILKETPSWETTLNIHLSFQYEEFEVSIYTNRMEITGYKRRQKKNEQKEEQ